MESIKEKISNAGEWISEKVGQETDVSTEKANVTLKMATFGEKGHYGNDDLMKEPMTTEQHNDGRGVITDPRQSTLPDTHRALVYKGKNKVAVENVPLQKFVSPRNEPLPHAVMCKVLLTNICGSDLHMYHGRTNMAKGLPLGHEITAEVVEKGVDVRFLNVGDIVSLPFNLSCGRCQNCKEMMTNACQHTNPAQCGGAFGYANAGGWHGGQSEYVLVPFADHNCLRFPDKSKAMTHLLDLAFLSDILPTGFHGCVQAGVQPGRLVFIAGAGPVGICAAASAQLMGAACVVVGDINPARLEGARQLGCLTIDLSQVKSTDINVELRKLTGYEFVDCAVECVGYECSGCKGETTKNVPCEALDLCIRAVKAGGKIGTPGVFLPMDPEGPDAGSKIGKHTFMFGELWNKGITLGTGQCPVSNYNYYLSQAILFDKLTVHKALNVKVIGLEDAPEAYSKFSEGEYAKYVIDPHNILGMRQTV